MTDDQIRHMAQRFLAWKLPKDFNPDGGISFERIANKGYRFQRMREPIGANLFSADQAEAMVRYLAEGLTQ